MTRLISNCFLVLAFAIAPLASAKTASPASPLPFPQEGSDLKPDPAAHFGALPNGLRYVIRPNHEPKGRVSLRLLVLAGSLEETDEQRGLAHFLEHMAFNGSKHYPAGTLVQFFQRMGMSFGGDTNASTSFDRTIYQLELAHANEETLKEGLRVIGDYADGLLLSKEEIDRERGVILSEKRASDSVGFRTFVAEFEATLGTTRLPRRIPIGEENIIKEADRDRFVDFWNTWYRPEKMVVVAVGDFADEGAIEKMIAQQFGSLRARGPSRPTPSLGELPKLDGVRAVFHAEPEAPTTSVSINRIRPYAPEPDNIARQIKQLPRSLALAMLNRRFSVLAKKADAPFVSASASVSERFDFFHEASVDLSCKPENWKEALAVGEQELRRALEHGFTKSELTEAAANVQNHLEQAARTDPTRHSDRIANEIVQTLVENDVLTTPADDLALLGPALKKITLNDCLAALRSDFASKGTFVMVNGNATIPGDASAAIGSAYESSHDVAVSPPAVDEKSAWAYTDFGAPGEIEKREHIDDLDLELVTFKNGVRLNLKKTGFEAGRISLSARVGTGGITEPASQRGLSALANRTLTAGGLGKHSVDDLREMFAGKNVGWSFTPDSDAFVFISGTTPNDLALDLQLLTAQLTDSGYRPEALRLAQKSFEQLYLSFAHTASGPLATDIANLLAGGDARFGMPAEEVMMSRNLDEVKAWLTPQFREGPIELAIVGDFDLEAAINAVAQTLGALPPRESKPDLPELKKVAFPAEPFAKDYVIDSEIPKGALLLFWPSNDAMDVHRNRRLSLLASILNDRLRVKVREDIGGTYSPHAGSSTSDTFPGYGYFGASIDIAPKDAEKMAKLVTEIADDLATHGVTADELERARLPLLTALKETLRNNGYWLSAVLSRAQEKPEVMDWARSRQADVESISTAELSELAKKYLGRDRVSRAIILPNETSRPAPASTANGK
ncbi:MAG: insulinase family protein [Chthoniobacterales bacterium]